MRGTFTNPTPYTWLILIVNLKANPWNASDPKKILEIVDYVDFACLFSPLNQAVPFAFLGLQVIERKKTASDLAGHRSYRALVTEAEAGGVPAAAAWSNG